MVNNSLARSFLHHFSNCLHQLRHLLKEGESIAYVQKNAVYIIKKEKTNITIETKNTERGVTIPECNKVIWFDEYAKISTGAFDALNRYAILKAAGEAKRKDVQLSHPPKQYSTWRSKKTRDVWIVTQHNLTDEGRVVIYNKKYNHCSEPLKDFYKNYFEINLA